MFRVFTVLLLITLSVLSQSPYKETYDKSFFRGQYPQKTPFLVRPYVKYLANDTFRVYFPAEIAYSLVQFVYKNPGYDGEVEIGISLTNTKTSQTQSKLWPVSFQTDTFRSTHSRTNAHFTVDSMDVPAGLYQVMLEFRDKNSSQRLMFTRKLTIDPVEETYYAKPLLYQPEKYDGGVFRFDKAYVSPLQAFWDYNTDLGVALAIWRKNPPRPVAIKLEFMNTKSSDVIYAMDTVLTSDNHDEVLQVEIPARLIDEGHHRLRIIYREGEDSTRVVNPVDVVWFDKPISLWDLGLTVSPLKYIVDEETYDSFSKGSEESRLDAIKAFWDERDPTPQTPYNELEKEFYTRVDSTISLFSTRKQLGWETDLGKVYIANGPPHKIEDQSLAPVKEPYLRWIYLQNDKQLIYTFEAVDGRKEYRLASAREVTL